MMGLQRLAIIQGRKVVKIISYLNFHQLKELPEKIEINTIDLSDTIENNCFFSYQNGTMTSQAEDSKVMRELENIALTGKGKPFEVILFIRDETMNRINFYKVFAGYFINKI